MKYSAIVLRNIELSVDSVEFAVVADELLSGGVNLGEIALLPYDAPASVSAVLRRMSGECDGVFLICDKVLLPAAREAIFALTGLEGETLFQGDTLFAVLPAGEEGRALVRNAVLPAVDTRRGQSYRSVVLKTVSAPREKLFAAAEKAREAGGGMLSVRVGTLFATGRIEVTYGLNTPKMLADDAVRVIATELEPYLYAMEDVSIGKRLFEALRLHRLRIATAESFTGGAVGEAIVSNPGASKVFYEGLNTYDRESKKERLGVSEYTLMTKGAVSGETAYEMAAGLLKEGHCDVAISTTGIAGPMSDERGETVGHCFIAVGTRERVRVSEYHLEGDRASITRQAVELALFLAYKQINS